MFEALGDLIKSAGEVPLPTIMVVAGLFLMLLSLVDKIIDSINIPEKRRSLTLKVGAALTALGVVMWFGTIYLQNNDGQNGGGNKPIADGGGATGGGGTGGNSSKPNAVTKDFYIQMVALSSFSAASQAAQNFRQQYTSILDGLDTKIESVNHPTNGKMYRVRFGILDNADKGDAICSRLKSAGAKQCAVVPG